jgi:hypothetical protein
MNKMQAGLGGMFWTPTSVREKIEKIVSGC